jgi:uncharacterized protein DUF1579
MKASVSFVAAALVFGFATVSMAQTKSKAPERAKAPEKAAPAAAAVGTGMPMKPAPEMDKIKWMTGTWQCIGKTMASPMGPEHPTEAEVKSEMALDGMWMLAHYREKKTPQNPMPVSGDEYWTYDAAGKMWDRVAVDNMGGLVNGTSKGWEKGKLVWMSEGMMGGQKMKFRDTFVQKNPRELSYTSEMGSAEGKWTTAWEATCKK